MRESHEIATKLSVDEYVALLYIATEPDLSDLPDRDTDRLVQLGLARISRGKLAYTDLGRTIAKNTVRMNSTPSAYLH